nr:RES family NAD+ phosphorylase [Cellulomonas hominis]
MAAGTELHRIGQYRYGATAFNPGPSHRYYGGGRFDSTDDDRYGFMYAGLTMDVAVAERLLRDQVPGPSGAIALPQAALDGLHAYTVTLALELQLVDMTGRPGLSSVAQSPWLTTAEPRDYAQTRHWAHWIRTQCPVAAGYIWVSRREPAGRVVVLFDDRTPNPASALLTPDPSSFIRLDDESGRAWLRSVLARQNATVS